MSAPEVCGTYPIPEQLRELLRQHADMFVPLPEPRPVRRFPTVEPKRGRAAPVTP